MKMTDAEIAKRIEERQRLRGHALNRTAAVEWCDLIAIFSAPPEPATPKEGENPALTALIDKSKWQNASPSDALRPNDRHGMVPFQPPADVGAEVAEKMVEVSSDHGRLWFHYIHKGGGGQVIFEKGNHAAYAEDIRAEIAAAINAAVAGERERCLEIIERKRWPMDDAVAVQCCDQIRSAAAKGEPGA